MGTKNDPGEFDCYAKLLPDEPYFLIRAKDPVGAATVREWCRLREEANVKPDDEARIAVAERCAEWMEQWREKHEGPKPFETSAGDLWDSTRRLVYLLEEIERAHGSTPTSEDAIKLAKEMENEAAPF